MEKTEKTDVATEVKADVATEVKAEAATEVKAEAATEVKADAKPGAKKERSSNEYISLTARQIRRIQMHSDPNKMDPNTKDRLKIAMVYIPSEKFRDQQFGVDKNGINRDERIGTINIPTSALFLNLANADGSKLTDRSVQRDVMLSGEGRNIKLINRHTLQDVSDQYKLVSLFIYPQQDRSYRIHFDSKRIEAENNQYQFDKPEPVDVNGAQLSKMYHDAAERSQKNKEQAMAQDKVAEKTQEEVKTETKAKPKTKTSKTKTSQTKQATKKKTKKKEQAVER